MLLKENTFVKKKYLRLYIACLIGWIITVAGDFFDSFAAGSYLDPNAVAAIELVTPLQLFIFFIGSIIVYGESIRYSQAIGEDNKEKAYKIAGMTLIVSVILAIVTYTLLMLSKYPILNAFNVSSEVFAYADEYYNLNMTLGLFVPIYYCFYYFVVFDGDEVNTAISDILMAVVTMVGPYLLVGPFGIKGIAITTPLSYVAAVIPSIIHLRSKRNSIHFKFGFDFKELIEGIKCASASTLVTLYIAVVDIIFNAMIVKTYSDQYLASYGVTNLILNMANTLLAPMSAASALIACSYGEKNPRAVKRVFKHCLKHGTFLSLGYTVIMCLLCSFIPSLYGIEDPAIFETARFACIAIPLFYIGYMICITFMSLYSMIDRPLFGNIIAALYMLVIPLLVVYPLGKYVSFNAMNMGFGVTPIISIVIMLIIFRFSKDKKSAPYFLKETDEDEYHYDIKLNKENIVELRDLVTNELTKRNIDSKITNEFGVVIEDALMYIYRMNKKDVIAEITILLNSEHLRLIIKDTGEIFDLISDANEGKNLRAYTIERLTSETYEKSNSVATSFNRNIYSWQLNK